MLLASANLMDHVSDHPWPGCQVEVFGLQVTWMSSGIATMILVGVLLAAGLLLGTRRWGPQPKGVGNLIEAIVVFVRDMIARPALHEKAYDYLPFLLTLFVFILGLNLFGLVPLEPVMIWLGGHVGWLKGRPVGGPTTSVAAVCAGLASLTLLKIITSALWVNARHLHETRYWPMALCLLVSPVAWFLSLAPQIPGVTGKILSVPLAVLELVGAGMKCVSLVIRLTANMVAGHALLAVLLMFALDAAAAAMERNITLYSVSAVCIVGSAAISLIELLVAGLQAYIFTFLTAMFLGLYVEPAH